MPDMLNAENRPTPIKKYEMKHAVLNANPAATTLFTLLLEDIRIVLRRSVRTAKAHGFIASTIAADINAGIVTFFLKADFSGLSNGEPSATILIVGEIFFYKPDRIRWVNFYYQQ